ncbi:uncharacterized protein [Oscarella lobularis]|uniref:uncharacterized protein n=1 Tax=Oscarella lobularis TaxID=121494 RepID=UPI0033144340
MSKVAEALDLSLIRYSHVWEDYRCLNKGLGVVPTDDILSVTSAGDNVLNLLVESEPRSITAIDMSPAQNAILHLKMTAIKHLSHPEFLHLLGLSTTTGDQTSRWLIYNRIRARLPPYAADYFDARRSIVEDGIASSGRLDRFFAAFRERLHAKTTITRDRVARLFDAESLGEQSTIFDALSTSGLRDQILDLFAFTKFADEGRSRAQMRHVDADTDVALVMWEHIRRTAMSVPLHDNFYMARFLLGDEATPSGATCPYVMAGNYQRLRALVDRVTVVTDTIEHFLATNENAKFSKMNLSDVFEYMSEEATESMFSLLADHMPSGGRLAYWTLFLHRAPSESLQLRPLTELSERLFKEEDRSTFYGSFQVHEKAAS